MRRLDDAGAVGRLLAKDPTLFSDDAAIQAKVAGRLGWVGLAAAARASAAALTSAAAGTREAGITDVVLLGMGGSSLAPLVISHIIGSAPGSPRLHVLDTTSSWIARRTMEMLEPRRTLVLVSSKSGTTIEPLSLYAVMREWADAALGPEAAGRHFVAVTDPGSFLEKLAGEQGFAATFLAPPDVGGRYSALTPFGTVPASLIGVDVDRLAARAQAMELQCAATGYDSPAASLAAWMADAVAEGRDKLTFLASESFAPFALWVEQLVAESTGKDGKGVLPVPEPGAGDPVSYGEDRMVFVLRAYEDESLAGVQAALPPGTPFFETIAYESYDLGAEFVRWEYATALLGHLIGVNPFDEPNVTAAKNATSAILDGQGRAPEPSLRLGQTSITTNVEVAGASDAAGLARTLEALLEGAGPGSYLAVLAYVPEDVELTVPLRDALAEVSRERKMAVTFGIGPRYLHSTGQYHKGGPATGRFLVVRAGERPDPKVPGKPYTLGELIRSQAEGDYMTLSARGLPVVMVDLPEPAHGPVRMLAETLRGAASA